MRDTILHLDYLAKQYNHSEAEVERIIDFLLRLVKFDPRIKMPCAQSMILCHLMLEWVFYYGSLEIHFGTEPDESARYIFKDERSYPKVASGRLLSIEQAVEMIKQIEKE